VARKAVRLAAFVVLVSNAVGLGFAWWNRSGEAEADVVLTEREIRVLPRDTENTAIALRLAWIDPSRAPGAATWFDAAKLTSVGFDCRAPLTMENASFYQGQAPRAGYAALEFEGDAWFRYIEAIPPGPDRESAAAGSHLVLIDVGLDPVALRRLHVDRRRVIIVPAALGLEYRRSDRQPPSLAGRVNMIYPPEVSVPRSVRGVFEGLAERRSEPFDPRQAWRGTPLPGPARYQVRVRWGRSLEPWLGPSNGSPTKLSDKNPITRPRA